MPGRGIFALRVLEQQGTTDLGAPAGTFVDITAATEADQALAFVLDLRVAQEIDQATVLLPFTAAAEVDTAQPLVVTKTIFKSLVPATETDTAGALRVPRLTAALETDSAAALAPNIRIASETDRAAPLIPNIRPAFETDTAVAVGFTQGGGGVDLTPATETDSAQALAPNIRVAQETDQAAILLPFKAANETDTARPLSVTKTIFKTLTPATETNAAQALVPNIRAAVETDTAGALTFSQAGSHSIIPAAESDTALALAPNVRAAAEADTARPVTAFKAKLLGTPGETDLAQPITHGKLVTLAAASETDTARELATPIRVTLVAAAETDSATALTFIATGTLGPNARITLSDHAAVVMAHVDQAAVRIESVLTPGLNIDAYDETDLHDDDMPAVSILTKELV